MRAAAAALAAVLTGCASVAPIAMAPELLAAFSTDESEWNATATRDGSTVVFARSPEADFEHAKVRIARQLGGRWTSAPAPFSTAHTDSDPQISADTPGSDVFYDNVTITPNGKK